MGQVNATPHHHNYFTADPLPLVPSRPIPLAQRTRRRVRLGGSIQSLRVLQPLVMTSDSRGYAIERIVTHMTKTGVLLLLATPVIPQRASSSSSCLVSCGDQVVIKAVPQPDPDAEVCIDDPMSEIAAMQLLMRHKPRHHPNVVTLLDSLEDEEYVYLVLPYLSGGDLFSRVKAQGNRGLTDSEAASYLRQIGQGLHFMKRTAGLAHHDVSLENVMLENDEDDVIKIIDLGMSLRVPMLEKSGLGGGAANEPSKPAPPSPASPIYLSPQHCRGKSAYVAPEVVREESFDPFAADVWSLGVCLYMMLTCRPLYHSPSDHVFQALSEGGIMEVVDSYEKHGLVLPPLAKDLVCRMLCADPRKRPSLEEVLLHPFIVNSRGTALAAAAAAAAAEAGTASTTAEAMAPSTMTSKEPTSLPESLSPTPSFEDLMVHQ